jgi:hypothetical protein
MHNLFSRSIGHGEYAGQTGKDLGPGITPYMDTWTYKHRLPWLHQDGKTADMVEDEEDEILQAIYKEINL